MASAKPSRLIAIENAPGYYAGDDGQVWSWKTKVLKAVVPQVDSRGYPAVFVYNGMSQRKQIRVHRLICQTFHGNPPNFGERKVLIRHLDGDRMNSRPENLAWGTYAQNYQDYVAHKEEMAYYLQRGPLEGLEEAPF